MRITMHEIEVLKAIGLCYPVKSSYAKLAKSTGKARNEIEELVGGLKAIGYVNVTPANEVYLIDDGRKYLGIGSNKPDSNKAIDKPSKAIPKLPVKDEQQVNDAIEGNKTLKPHLRDDIDFSTEQHPVLASIDALSEKLNKPKFVIEDLDLKGQALAKLAPLLSDDIAELLLEVKDDLERAAA